MAYLVTGGTGLIGSYTVRDLVREGAQVVIYDLLPNAGVLEGLLSDEERSRTKTVQGDVSDVPHLLRTIKEHKVEAVFHLASLLGDASNSNPPQALSINCGGTVNVFEAARRAG